MEVFWRAILDGNAAELQSVCDDNVLNTLVEGKAVAGLANARTRWELEHHWGRSPLMVASGRGQYDVVKFLLEKGAQVDFLDEYGKSALMLASEYNVAKLLVESGARVNRLDTNGKSALIIASENGHSKVVEFLLGEGAEVNLQDGLGRSALMLASRCWQSEVVKVLIECGAQVDLEDELGCRRLFLIMCRDGNLTISKLIMEKTSLVKQTAVWENALSLACSYSHKEIVKLLVANYFPKDHWFRVQRSRLRYDKKSAIGECLVYACREGSCEIIELMRKNGCSVVVMHYNGVSALTTACSNGHFEVAKLLVKWDSGVVKRDTRSLLFFAAKAGSVQLVSLLLDLGTAIGGLDKGLSALKAACIYGHYEVAELLLKRGAVCCVPECTYMYNFYQDKSDGNDGSNGDVSESYDDDSDSYDDDSDSYNAGAQGMPVSALACAIKGRNLEVVKLLLDKSTHSCLCSSLACAMSYGEDKIVQLFLARFTQNDLLAADGTSPLMFACCHGLDKMAKMLIVSGAQIDVQDNEGMSPLMFASKNGCNEVARVLLENDAQVNMQRNDGRSALMLIGLGDVHHMEIAKLLLGRNAVVNLLDRYGCQGLLPVMCGIGNLPICREILDRYPDCFPYVGQCIARACEGGHFEVVKLLLTHCATINDDVLSVVAREGLHSAIKHGQYEMVELFLEGCIQVDELDEGGRSPLLLASKFGNLEVAMLLLDKGAQIDLQDRTGTSSLMIASCLGHCEMVKLLLEKGAQVKLRDSVDESLMLVNRPVLMLACNEWFHEVTNTLPSVENGYNAFDLLSAVEHNPYFEIVNLLLHYGAQIRYQDKNCCFKLLLLLSLSGNLDIVRSICSVHSCDKTSLKQALTMACIGGNCSVVEVLLLRGALCGDMYSTLALLCASAMGHCEVVKLLLDRKLSVNVEDDRGMSALMVACHRGHQEVVNLLLERGAKIDHRDHFFSQPRNTTKAAFRRTHDVSIVEEHYARNKSSLMLASEEGHQEVVKLLLERGAQVDLQDAVGKSALTLAVEKRHGGVVRLLEDHTKVSMLKRSEFNP